MVCMEDVTLSVKCTLSADRADLDNASERRELELRIVTLQIGWKEIW
jgi:hypothetical protein